MTMQPIGYMQSVFKYKNGTPRQPMLCPNARGILTIIKDVFNNPEHSLEGLDKFSHIWILFAFHKNNNVATKAKVKPPRLNGKRVGLFATRSPHRPNPIGLTLARVDKVQGATIYLSGIDILDGTPVLDIKPYIPDYDIPQAPDNPTTTTTTPLSTNKDESVCTASNVSDEHANLGTKSDNINVLGFSQADCLAEERWATDTSLVTRDAETKVLIPDSLSSLDTLWADHHLAPSLHNTESKNEAKVSSFLDGAFNVRTYLPDSQTNSPAPSVQVSSDVLTNTSLKRSDTSGPLEEDSEPSLSKSLHGISETSSSKTASISLQELPSESPVPAVSYSWVSRLSQLRHALEVTFTPRSEIQMLKFSKHSTESNFVLKLLDSAGDVKSSIVSILREDPRSVYRRQKCADSLYFFSVDSAHVTCWFDGNVAEVVRVQPLSCAVDCKSSI